MQSDNSKEIFVDSSGIRRSKSLPRVAGNRIQLPAKITDDDGLKRWEERVQTSELITLDLFCGAGGMSLGFEDAGFFIASGIDLDDSSIMTHGCNFLSKSVVHDLTQIENPKSLLEELGIPRVDIIIGGPPCQGFSNATQPIIKNKGLEAYYHDVLNNLYQEFLRFIEALKPKAFVMENVPAMASFRKGELLKRILKEVENLGYKTDFKIINAVEHGVPQKRKRLFIQGNLLGLPIVWPQAGTNQVTVREAIEDLPKKQPPATEECLDYSATNLTPYQKKMREKMPLDHQNCVFDHIIRAVREDDKIIFSLMNEGDRYIDIPEEFRRYRSDIFKDKYSKMVWDNPSWTVTAHISKDAYRYIHPDPEQGRMLSVREFARLQSFPDHFRFCGAPTKRMRQIGNAVPPLLAFSIASVLYQQILRF